MVSFEFQPGLRIQMMMRLWMSLWMSLWLTDDVAAVVSDQGLAVNVDEFSDERRRELRVSSQATEGDVLRPHVFNWGAQPQTDTSLSQTSQTNPRPVFIITTQNGRIKGEGEDEDEDRWSDT